MNPKLSKLHAELDKNTERIQKLQARNEALQRKIQEAEDAEILGIVRTCSMTPEQLSELIRASKLPTKEDAPIET